MLLNVLQLKPQGTHICTLSREKERERERTGERERRERERVEAKISDWGGEERYSEGKRF